ncbi:hypothetical protein [Amycolatopsis sp. NBC_00355]|uniref:hypothetical protein n=1 Tax=Amycolatopsis sp. NBC_00355 TaxID=2975957 RepID=UPI002E26013D
MHGVGPRVRRRRCGDRTSNLTAWTAVLGDRRGTDDVSPYTAAARATDLSGLPPTFVVWGGAFHG